MAVSAAKKAVKTVEEEPKQQIPNDGALEGLDDLDDFDLDEGDVDLLDGELDGVEIEDVKNIDEPHLLMDSKSLIELLKPIHGIIRDDNEIFSRCVLIKPRPGYVDFYVNTGEFVVMATARLENSMNLLEKDFVIEFKHLYTVLQNSGSKFVIKEIDGTLVVAVYGGEVEFEVYNLDTTEFAVDNLYADYDPIDFASFAEFLSRAKRLFPLASRPEDRRCRVEDGNAYFNFLTNLAHLENVPLTNISLRAMDVDFLLKMAATSVEVGWKELDGQVLFVTDCFKCLIPKIDTADLGPLKGMLADIKMDQQFPIAPSQVMKVLQMMKGLIGNSGVCTIKIKDGRVTFNGKTQTGKRVEIPVANVDEALEMQSMAPIVAIWTAAAVLKTYPVVRFAYEGNSRFSMEAEGVRIIFGHVGG